MPVSDQPRVAVLMGSDSDLPTVLPCLQTLADFGVPYDVRVLSAHRTPDETHDYTVQARARGVKVFICAAGMAAHLAGAVAALTTLPVIGVPVGGSALQGIDALLATVQMPPGVPVATTAIGKAGATNAGLLAVQMLALSDDLLAKKLDEHKQTMAEKVMAKNDRVQTSNLP